MVVAIALLVVAAPRPVTGARIYGGPSPDSHRLSARVVVNEQRGDQTRAVPHRPIGVEMRDGGEQLATWTGELDADGSASVTLQSARPLPPAPVLLVTAPWTRGPLALGSVEIQRQPPPPLAADRGGWIAPPRKGGLHIQVAPAAGALAVPFETTLLVEVLRDGAPVANVHLDLDGESLDVVGPVLPTNEYGRTTARVRPTAHVAALSVRGRAAGGVEGRWYSTLPTVGGAMVSSVSATGELLIQSPIQRDRAYFSVVTPRGRWTGGTVHLAPDERGGAAGRTPFEAPRASPAWLVVSSELDLRSPSTVGWPLEEVEHDFLAGKTRRAPHTRTTADELLLDGMSPLLQLETRRQTQVRQLTALFVVTAMALVALLVMLQVRDSDRRLQAHLHRNADQGERPIAVSRAKTVLGTAVAVLCIVLGFMILALLAMLRV